MIDRINELRPSVGGKIEVDANGCWLWRGWIHDSGYGYVNLNDTGVLRVHRYVFQQLAGPIPDGLVLDHLCRVRHCCNPEHLEVVTRAENTRRGAAARTTCRYGHPFTGAVDYRGHRYCAQCLKDSYQRNIDDRRAAARERMRRLRVKNKEGA